jgi:hypothetical protein
MSALAGLSLTLGCASASPTASDLAEVLLPVPESQVRTALVEVLREGGYDIDRDEAAKTVVRTGYRQETDSPWDWLLRSRFGVTRTRVEATIASADEHTTQLTIRVTHEGKDSLFKLWGPYETPLPQSAANQIRLVKNALGLLNAEP